MLPEPARAGLWPGGEGACGTMGVGEDLSAPEFKLRGLILYGRGDEASARWLRGRLTAFELPRAVRKGGSARLGRFHMEGESDGPPSRELVEALAHSEWLIVACSPATGASRWFDMQIDAFMAAHGIERVRAVLLDGDPREAFPRAVRFDQYFAADFRLDRDGRELGVVKLVASMLGVAHAALFDQQTTRTRTRGRARLALEAGLAAVAAVAVASAPLALQRAQRAETQARAAIDVGAGILERAGAVAERSDAAKMDMQAVLGFARTGFDQVFRQGRQSPQAIRQRASLHVGIADGYGRIGDSQRQRESAEAALALFAGLTPGERRTSAYAQALTLLAESDLAQGRQAQGLPRLGEAVAAWRAVAQGAPNNAAARLELAKSLHRLGALHLAAGRAQRALAPLGEAATQLEGLAAQSTDDDILGAQVAVRDALGEAHAGAGDLAAARAANERAIASARAWLARGAAKREARASLGDLLMTLGQAYAEAGDVRRARAPLEESLAIARDLARAAPQDETLQGDVALRLMLTADVLLELRVAAAPMLAEATSMGRTLVARNPGNADLKDMLAEMLGAQARRASADGDREEARTLWTEVVRLRAGLSAAAPNDSARLRELAAAHKRVGDLSVRLNDKDGAARAYAAVVSARRALLALAPDDVEAKRGLAASLRELGASRARANNPRGAIRAFAEAAEIRLALADEDASHRGLALEAATDLARMPLDEVGAGAAAARPVIEHARATLANLASNYPNDRRYPEALARTEALLAGGSGAT